LNQFGFNVSYATLKNYYIERRVLPESFFRDLCFISKQDARGLKVVILGANWGQKKKRKRKAR
jgi:hypothetical protein